ncbi:hypothetical protein Hanom_Chr07g00631201 [Helianthus anomalus]
MLSPFSLCRFKKMKAMAICRFEKMKAMAIQADWIMWIGYIDFFILLFIFVHITFFFTNQFKLGF